MRLLLDTHTLLWWLSDDPELSADARSEIANPTATVFVSAATAWEMAIKQAAGKLDAPPDLERQLELNNFEPLSITIRNAYDAATLPRHHEDSFDRMLVAQALAEDLRIVTRDPRIRAYGVATVAA